jgi:precorrin-8X/cobalt-precorrin-8 methylmutase
MTPTFDRYAIVDWSAANAPKRGKDSIWIAEANDKRMRGPVNPATRAEAMARIEALCADALAAGERLLIGFDFPFGYPKGAAKRMTGDNGWRALWAFFAREIEDDDANRSNRYALADRLNRDVFREPLYWGRPHQHAYAHLPAKRAPCGMREAMAMRRAEAAHPPAKSVWQLAYNGAVGSQAMLGIARLERLRRLFKGQIAVWPFETAFAEKMDAPIVLAEIYPSLLPVTPEPDEPKDRAQVRALARHFRKLDQKGKLRDRLDAPSMLTADEREIAAAEEGWILSPCEAA